MKKVYSGIMRVAMLGVLAMTVFTSINQLNTSMDHCSGLACEEAEDCGTSCFCNRTVKMCVDLQE